MADRSGKRNFPYFSYSPHTFSNVQKCATHRQKLVEPAKTFQPYFTAIVDLLRGKLAGYQQNRTAVEEAGYKKLLPLNPHVNSFEGPRDLQ